MQPTGAVAITKLTPLQMPLRNALPMVGITTPCFTDFHILPDERKCLNRSAKVITIQSIETISSEIVINEWEQSLCNNFQPSRLRHLPSIIATTAAGVQRSGAATPGFLPRGLTPSTALEIARPIDPYNRLLKNHFAPTARGSSRMLPTKPKLVKTTRRRAIRLLTHLAHRLQPNQRRLDGVLDKKSPARRLNIPLIAFLVAKLGYTDTTLPTDLTKGVKIDGEIPASDGIPSRVTSALRNLNPLNEGVYAGNKAIVRSITKTANTTTCEKRWELSWKEHEQGWLTKPTPLAECDLRALVISPRFCISEQHGLQPKHRVVGDLSRSLANSTTATVDTYCPQDLDTIVSQSRLLTSLWEVVLQAWSVGFSNAYKTIGLRETSYEAAVVCVANPVTKVPHKAQILAQPFGSRRAPANWGRVVSFIQFVALRLFRLSVGSFVDDVYCSEPASTISSGFWVFKRLYQLLGFPTSDRKDQPPTREFVLLGALIAIEDSSIRASIRPDRVNKLRSTIAQALQTCCLSPAAARKLRGN